MVGSVVYGLPYYHLWYLYMVVGLYLFVPFLAKIIRHSNQKELLILCGVLFAFSMLGNAFINYSVATKIPAVFTFIYYLPYFLAGYVISKIDYQPPAWALWVTFAVSGVLNSICYYLTLGPDRASNEYFFNTLCITIVPMSISMMFLIRKIRIPGLSQALGSKIAFFSLGIYLIHPFFLDILNYIGVTALVFTPVLAVPILASLTFVISLGVVAVAAKIPWLNKAIGVR
jgi:surface polysaccharide O-acyltransferase-like enzyme